MCIYIYIYLPAESKGTPQKAKGELILGKNTSGFITLFCLRHSGRPATGELRTGAPPGISLAEHVHRSYVSSEKTLVWIATFSFCPKGWVGLACFFGFKRNGGLILQTTPTTNAKGRVKDCACCLTTIRKGSLGLEIAMFRVQHQANQSQTDVKGERQRRIKHKLDTTTHPTKHTVK